MLTILRNITFLICGFLLLAQSTVQGQGTFPFTIVNEQDGLASNFCYQIFQDSRGYIWVCTQNGLSCYLGNRFKNFKPEKDNPNSIGGLIIKEITEDEDGMLWIAVQGGGLNKYDPISNTFTRYEHDPEDKNSLSSNQVSSVYLDKNQQLWVGTVGYGLNLFDRKTATCQRFPLTDQVLRDDNRMGTNTVYDILETPYDPKGVWMAGNSGLYRLDKEMGKVKRYPSTRQYTEFMSTHKLLQGPSGSFWVGTYGGGVVLFKIHDATWEYFPAVRSAWEAYSSRDNIILDMTPKSPTELWVASKDQGLGIFDIETHTYQFLETLVEKDAKKSVNALFKDVSGRLWVANNENGLSIADPKSRQFEFISLGKEHCFGGENNHITSFAEDVKNNLLYVTTSGCSGLALFEKNANKWSLKKTIKTEKFTENTFFCSALDRDNTLWVGGDFYAWSGGAGQGIHPSLWQLENASGELKVIEHPDLKEMDFKSAKVPKIQMDEQGDIWIAANNMGLIRYRKSDDSYVLFPITDGSIGAQISDMIIAEDASIWVVTTEQGLFHFFPPSENEKGNFEYIDLGIPHVHCIAQHPNGKLWIGTNSSGIHIFDSSKPISEQKFKHISSKEGLPYPKINFIKKASDGKMWVSTETGICYWNEATQKMETFNQSDGIPDAYYWYKGFEASPSGSIFLGQEGGFCVQSKEWHVQQYSPIPLIFNDLKVLGKSRTISAKPSPEEEITLKHDENFFTFQFSALDFTRPDKVRYSYKLEGIDDDWKRPQDNRGEAAYTKLPPGNYTFRVQAFDHLGQALENELSIGVKIRNPWWATWFAYLLYALSLIAALIWFFDNRIKSLLAQEESKRLKELDEQKTKLYANITHEFRTPLTLILGPTERAIGTFEKAEKKEFLPIFETVKSNAQRLLNLVNQILDVQYVEDDSKTEIFHEKTDIILAIQQATEAFRPIAKVQGIQLSFDAEPRQLEMTFDPDKLLKILQNLLSNAFKFTTAGGHVSVFVQKKNDQLSIAVTDTGKGITQEDLGHIFERFFKGQNNPDNQNSSGIGLSFTKELVELMEGSIHVKSKIGKGSTFTVSLPIIIKKQAATTATLTNTQGSFSNSMNTQILDNQSNILVIEDNPEIMKYIGSCLPDYNVFYAEDGEAGLEKAFDNIPDLVITDWMMPKKDGIEVCESLKSDPRTSHIPIILLTARASVGSRLEGLRKGADIYLSKPFVEEELQIQVSKLLKSRQDLAAYLAQKPLGEIDAKEAASEKAEIAFLDLEIENEFLEKTRTTIIEHLDDVNFNVEKLGQTLFLSHTQLHRKISALTNKSPKQIITEVRLQTAQKYLKVSDKRIGEIALEVGFEDPSYFARVFKKEFGMTPKQFRDGK